MTLPKNGRPNDRTPSYWFWVRTGCQLLIQEVLAERCSGLAAIIILKRGADSESHQEFTAMATINKFGLTPYARIILTPTFYGASDSVQNLFSMQNQLDRQLKKLTKKSLRFMPEWIVCGEAAIRLTELPTFRRMNSKHDPILEPDEANALYCYPIKDDLDDPEAEELA